MRITFGLIAAATLAGQTFPLRDPAGLSLHDLKAEAVTYQARKAIRLTTEQDRGEGFAVLPGTADFQDGVIEADLALKVTTPPGVRNPGFIGIAFRTRADLRHYDMFYIRPGNSGAPDQAMRNHAVQYVAAPEHGWYQLRRHWPWVYESHAEMTPEAWTHVKLEIAGRGAKLYLNESTSPSLIIDGLKGADLNGSVALWAYAGQESYFSNVRIVRTETSTKLKNGSDIAGVWNVRYSSDAGPLEGSMTLKREGNSVTGTWSGGLGKDRAVTGLWRDGYVELSFAGEWPKEAGIGTPGPVMAYLAGWIDGHSAKGRMGVEGRSDGQWVATKQGE